MCLVYLFIFASLRLYSVVFIARDSSLSSRRSNDRAGEDGCRYCCTYIVLLAETEEAADLGGSLGTEALRVDDVGQAGDVVVALLDDGEGEDGQIASDNAAADRLASALAFAPGSVAGVAVGEEEADTGRVHDTLLHGETLLVVAAGDAEDVALELITEVVAGYFLTHLVREQTCQLHQPIALELVSIVRMESNPDIDEASSLFSHENIQSRVRRRGDQTYALLLEVPELSLIINIDQLLAAIGRE